VATTKQAAQPEQPRPVLMKKGTAAAVLQSPERTGARLLVTLGGAIALYELVRVGLLWFPPQLGIAAWEFGTVTETFDVLPLLTIGATLMALGVVQRPGVRPGTVRTWAVAFAFAAVFVLLAARLYVRSIPTVLAEAPGEALVALRRSIIETGTAITVSTIASLVVSILLWRSIGKGHD
jgi:hypothetical protein